MLILRAKFSAEFYRGCYSRAARCISSRRPDSLMIKKSGIFGEKNQNNSESNGAHKILYNSGVLNIQDTLILASPMWIYVSSYAPVETWVIMWLFQPVIMISLLKCCAAIMSNISNSVEKIYDSKQSKGQWDISFVDWFTNLSAFYFCVSVITKIVESLIPEHNTGALLPALLQLYLLYKVFEHTQNSTPYLLKYMSIFCLVAIPMTSIKFAALDVSLLCMLSLYVSNIILSSHAYMSEKTVSDSILSPVLTVKFIRALFAVFAISCLMLGVQQNYGLYYYTSVSAALLYHLKRFIDPKSTPSDILKIKPALLVFLLVIGGIVCERLQKLQKRQQFLDESEDLL